MSEGERRVDLVREGIDCVMRFGHLVDSDLIARRLILLTRLTCASPSYVERHGTPASPQELEGHRMVGLRSLTTGALRTLDFVKEGSTTSMALPTTISVTGTESFLTSVKLGLGIAQIPHFHAEAGLREGSLVQVLPDWPPPSIPVSILYSRSRQLSPRLRVFSDWLVRQFADRPNDGSSG